MFALGIGFNMLHSDDSQYAFVSVTVVQDSHLLMADQLCIWFHLEVYYLRLESCFFCAIF